MPVYLPRQATVLPKSGDLFQNFYSRMKNRPKVENLPQYILGLDPGETTGVCIITPDEASRIGVRSFQVNTSIIEWGVDNYSDLIPNLASQPYGLLTIIESYRIYAWRTRQHTWASLLTPRLIGVAECLCRLRKVPLIQQSAQQGKSFVSDERLQEWHLYIPGHPHAMDALRHVLNFLLFGEFENV